jgi:hypothetical protein
VTRPDFEQVRAKNLTIDGCDAADIDALLAVIDELESFRSAHAADRQAIEAERAQHGVTVANLKSRLSGAAIDDAGVTIRELLAYNDKVTAELPVTFFAGLPLEKRVQKMVEMWNRAIKANNELEARNVEQDHIIRNSGRIKHVMDLEARNAKLEAVAEKVLKLTKFIDEETLPLEGKHAAIELVAALDALDD